LSMLPIAFVPPEARALLLGKVIGLQLLDGVAALLRAESLVELDACPGAPVVAQAMFPGSALVGFDERMFRPVAGRQLSLAGQQEKDHRHPDKGRGTDRQ